MENMIQVKIQDNGLGMTPEDQASLFSKFFRSADDKVREAPGTGLGLSITKNLIELQGGKIWFGSEYRKGTTFYFTVPVYNDQDKK
jgi:signal transduction histidine kinase